MTPLLIASFDAEEMLGQVGQWVLIVLVIAGFAWLTSRAISHERDRLRHVRDGTLDTVTPNVNWRYSRLLFQILFTITMVLGGWWLCSVAEQDFRDLDSGAVSSLKVNNLIALAYNILGSTGAIITVRVLVVFAALGSLAGIKEALNELKANRSQFPLS